MQLLNYAIENEWKDHSSGSKRPDWMRQREFLPCKCKKCFFCLNEYCNGIYHKPITTTKIFEATGEKRKVKGCTDVQVEIRKKSAYCRQCYRNSNGNAETKEWKCNYSKFGCPMCNEPICKACWEKGYDKHNK